jgi:hypothetical protein
VSLNALAATLIPPRNGTAAFAGVNAANHSAPTSIPHVTTTTRIMLLLGIPPFHVGHAPGLPDWPLTNGMGHSDPLFSMVIAKHRSSIAACPRMAVSVARPLWGWARSDRRHPYKDNCHGTRSHNYSISLLIYWLRLLNCLIPDCGACSSVRNPQPRSMRASLCMR